jgi:hypothetical protein
MVMEKILNCKASNCPQVWGELTQGDNAFTKFCHVCFKKVLLVEDEKLREDYMESGSLVAAGQSH